MGRLEEIRERLERIETRLAKCDGADSEMVHQRDTSPLLGARRHCAAVRRLVAEGDHRAHRKGRGHFMTRQAMDEEVGRLALAAVPSAPAANDSAGEGSAYSRAMQKALALESGSAR